MKHLLNNLTEEEKNSIREQHTGGMNVIIENFSKLINTKSGDVKLFLNEQETPEQETPTKDMYSVLIGYLVKLSEDGTQRGIKGIDDMEAIKEARMYFESLRDGITPQPLSQKGEIVKNIAMTNTKNLEGQELFALKELGKNIETKM